MFNKFVCDIINNYLSIFQIECKINKKKHKYQENSQKSALNDKFF